MAYTELPSPFGTEPIEEIPLSSSPLVRVLAQIRFPRLAAWVDSDTIPHAFASAMSGGYPILSPGEEVSAIITPDGVATFPSTSKLWKLKTADEAWQINYGDTFITLHTADYVDRAAFFDRLRSAVAQFAKIASPPHIERIGVRYINRIEDSETIAGIADLVKPEVLGAIAIDRPESTTLTQSHCETIYRFDRSEGLHARWGILPPGAALDPTIESVEVPSWILDLDAFHHARHEMEAEVIAEQAAGLAERCYRYFRWAVTRDFLVRFGAKL